MLKKIKTLLAKPFFQSNTTIFWLWTLLALVAMTKLRHGHNNNFLVFRYVFWHTINGQSLYAEYPEYFDVNHYGPVFSLVVAPFAWEPVWMGMLLWLVALAWLLFFAVKHSTLSTGQRVFVGWFCAHELLAALFMQQFNIAIVALLLMAFWAIEREKEPWAAFCIMLGTMVKLYGIVGLAFFLFSKHRGKLVMWLAIWAAVMFAAPMLISSPEYVVGQYAEWYDNLVTKNQGNMFASAQNISLLGMVRKISGVATYSDLWLIVPGMVLFALPLLRLSQYRHLGFRQTLLASVLMFVVLFSTGTENSGYVIALVGVVIWYVAAPWKRSRWDVALMVYALIGCSFAHSDLFPHSLRDNIIRPYALKALPIAIIWFKLCYEMAVRKYEATEVEAEPNDLKAEPAKELDYNTSTIGKL